MPPYVRPTKPIGLRVSPEMRTWLEGLAKEEDRSLAYVVKRILAAEMAREARTKKAEAGEALTRSTLRRNAAGNTVAPEPEAGHTSGDVHPRLCRQTIGNPSDPSRPATAASEAREAASLPITSWPGLTRRTLGAGATFGFGGRGANRGSPALGEARVAPPNGDARPAHADPPARSETASRR